MQICRECDGPWALDAVRGFLVNGEEELVRYLAAKFGPGNNAFRPVIVQPLRSSR
jgi:hypothetical protein